jgi:proline dehydrogenase
MKKSEFKSYIREEIISVLSEAGEQDLKTQQDLNKELEKTIELSKQLSEADPADIKAQQDLGKELDNTKSKVDALTKASQDSPLAEDEDEEPTATDLKKKDSVATTASKLQKLTAKMKDLAKAYKEAEGDKKEKIKDELKSLTAEKKKLERAL